MPVGANANDTAKDLTKARASPGPSDCHFRVSRHTSSQNTETVIAHPSKKSAGFIELNENDERPPPRVRVERERRKRI